MSSCGYIRSSILAILSEFALDEYYTEKESLEVHLYSVKELNCCTLLFSPSTELLGSNETESDTSRYSDKELKKCHILYMVIDQSGIIVYQNNVIKLGDAITRKVSTKRNISDRKSGVNM